MISSKLNINQHNDRNYTVICFILRKGELIRYRGEETKKLHQFLCKMVFLLKLKGELLRTLLSGIDKILDEDSSTFPLLFLLILHCLLFQNFDVYA